MLQGARAYRGVDFRSTIRGKCIQGGTSWPTGNTPDSAQHQQTAHRDLSGSVEVVSDCLGALKRVTKLPAYRIPSRCRHSDILKTILVHCRDFFFTTYYTHIKAHQDDNKSFAQLSRKAQLNCICDHAAKQRMAMDGAEGSASSRMFPLEPIGIFVGGKKTTSETGGKIRFWAHHQLAREYYIDKKSCPLSNLTWSSGGPSTEHYTISLGSSKSGPLNTSSELQEQ